MVKQIVPATLFIYIMVSPSPTSFAQGRTGVFPLPCLHDPAEQPNERSRREQALKIARQINLAEHSGPRASTIPGQSPDFLPFEQLPIVLPVPTGFRLQFKADGKTYAFSLKDTLDSCHFSIFSDQDQWIYQGTPQTGPSTVEAR